MGYDERKRTAQSLVSLFNNYHDSRFKYTGDNVGAFIACLTVADEQVVREAIRTDKQSATPSEFSTKFLVEIANKRKEAAESAQIEEAERVSEMKQETQQKTDSMGSAIGVIAETVAKMVADVKSEEIQERVGKNMQEQIRQFIADEYGHIERKITVSVGDTKTELSGVLHEKFDAVLQFVMNDEPVYLVGAAGTGKNYMCKQIADSIGLKFYFTNAVTQEYKLTGFTDAMGTFHESQFYKAFKNGGLFFLDEMDASIPEVLIILNAAIANRYFDFPAPIGFVEAHKDFRVVAGGNTLGHGADSEYVGRNTLDAASLDRFALVHIDYDHQIEMNCANGDKQLVDFVHDYRKACKKAGIGAVASYRGISRVARMQTCMELNEVMASCLFKSLVKDDFMALAEYMRGSGKYYDSFNHCKANALDA